MSTARRVSSSKLGPAYVGALDDHRRLLRAVVECRGGRVVDAEGDATFAVFPRAADAVAAAQAAQQALAEHPWPEGAAGLVRIGLHTGEPMIAGDGNVGLDVHRPAWWHHDRVDTLFMIG